MRSKEPHDLPVQLIDDGDGCFSRRIHCICIPTSSNPGRPEAVNVGNPAASADGCALVTAKALNLPDLDIRRYHRYASEHHLYFAAHQAGVSMCSAFVM